MKITVTIDAQKWPATQPYKGSEYVDVHGAPACCGDVLQVSGGATTEGHDTVTARAHCARCGKHVGEIVVTLSTLFGIEEDRRVLVQGRCRVY